MPSSFLSELHVGSKPQIGTYLANVHTAYSSFEKVSVAAATRKTSIDQIVSSKWADLIRLKGRYGSTLLLTEGG